MGEKRNKKSRRKMLLTIAGILITYCVIFIIAMLGQIGSESGISFRFGMICILLHIFGIVVVAVMTYDRL